MNKLDSLNSKNYNTALYIRLSKEDEKPGESESIINQRNLLLKFATDHNLIVIDEYVDDGVSGTTFNRPNFQRMIKDIEAKKINLVLTKDLSRLGRDYIQTGFYIEKYFPENNVRYMSILDNIDTGIDSSFNDITPFKSILNDMYAKDISYKIKSVKHNKQDLGLFIGGKAPFGYKCSKETSNKIIIDEEARYIIERIFKEAKTGKSCRAIAQDLTLNNVPTPSKYAFLKNHKISKISNYWSDSRIREILLNEVYIGNMVQGKSKKLNYKSKKTIKIPKSEWKIVSSTHEAIIDKDTFDKVQNLIATRKQTRVKTHDYLLKGFIYCHECGKKMGCSSRKLKKGNVYYLRCATYISYTQLKLCTSHNIRLDIVENITCNTIISLLKKYLNEELFKQIITRKLEKKKKDFYIENNIEIYTSKLNKLILEIDTLYDDKLKKLLSLEDFKRIYKNKKEEKENIEKKLFEFGKNLDNNISINETKLTEKIISNLYSSKKINRELFSTLVEKVEIDMNKNIFIYFKFNSK